MFSPQTHTSNFWKSEQITLKNTQVCTYMHMTTINEKSSHKFEKEQGGWSIREWLENRKRKGIT